MRKIHYRPLKEKSASGYKKQVTHSISNIYFITRLGRYLYCCENIIMCVLFRSNTGYFVYLITKCRTIWQWLIPHMLKVHGH